MPLPPSLRTVPAVPDGPTPSGPLTSDQASRVALRRTVMPTVVVGVLAIVISTVVAGSLGALGATLGFLITIVFFAGGQYVVDQVLLGIDDEHTEAGLDVLEDRVQEQGRLAGARGGHQGERCAVERHAPGVQRPLPAAAEHGQPVAQHPHALGDRLRRDGPQQLPLGAPLNQVAALDARNGDIRTFGVGDGALDRWVDSQGVAHRFGCQHVETKIAVADGD